MNYKNHKIKILDLKEFIGKTREELRNHLLKEYPKDGWELAGTEYRDWLYENPSEAPQELKDESVWFYFMKDVFCHSYCYWDVPFAIWHGTRFRRDGDWLGNDWYSSHRVVLVETLKSDSLPSETLILEIEIKIGGKRYKLTEI